MATVMLKKSYKNARGEFKAGETISVPYGEGMTITADGTAEYPKQIRAVPPATVPTAEQRYAEQIAKLKAEHAAEIAKLKAEHAAASKSSVEATKKK